MDAGKFDGIMSNGSKFVDEVSRELQYREGDEIGVQKIIKLVEQACKKAMKIKTQMVSLIVHALVSGGGHKWRGRAETDQS